MKNNRAIEYQMSKQMFDAILATRSETEKKENPYAFVMSVLNEQYGLRGIVKSISISQF